MKRENEFVKGNLWLAHKRYSSAQSDPRYLNAAADDRKRRESDAAKATYAGGATARAAAAIGKDAVKSAQNAYIAKNAQGPTNSSANSEQYTRAQQQAANERTDQYSGAKQYGQQQQNAANKAYDSGKQRAMDSYIRSEAAKLASQGNAARAKGGNAPKPPKYGTVSNQEWKAAYNHWYYYDRKDDPNNPWAKQLQRRREGITKQRIQKQSPVNKDSPLYAGPSRVSGDYRSRRAGSGLHGTNVTQAEYGSWKSRDTSGPSLRDKAKSLGGEIVNAGKNYLSNYADGAKQIKAYWKVGASEIADKGKKFIQSIFSK